jgi:type II secretory pathway component PulM
MLQSTPDSEFDARWAAWLLRGAAHDRAVRHRFMILGPAAFVAAVVVYVIFIG